MAMRSNHYIPIAVFIGHTVVVLGVAIVVLMLKGESIHLWSLVMAVDFPLIPIFSIWPGSLIFDFVENLPRETRYTAGYGVMFGVLGGGFYYIASLLLVVMVKRFVASRKLKR